ncbi:MAG TPA: xanthine dehydrogenase family protein molybdopterin-binding subunit [Stellaceae bacterium]|nr:xanthine dehydrogenase family protein molybdopterin-binding subunit [Stellaceae bacterium]
MSDRGTSGEGIGQPVRRKEDLRLLTGRGHYAADHRVAGMAFAALVRSPHPHARIRGIDGAAAQAAPGVIAVFTGADFVADGRQAIPHNPTLQGQPDVTVRLRPGATFFVAAHQALPTDTVRFVGEPVALVVAESADAARDAAELVAVDYQPLPAVALARDAVRPGAPVLWPGCDANLCVDGEVGDEAATAAAFAGAAHVVRLETWIQRVTGCPLEPRAAIGDYDAATERFTIWAGSGGGVVRERQTLAGTLAVPLESCRALCGDMGGNFGTRNTFFPEYALLPWAAYRSGRPVKWIGDRQECFLSDYQGRDLTVEAELALDRAGNFLALRGTNLSNVGAYTAHFTPLRKGLGIMSGVYRIPAVHFRGLAALTNTPPTTPYRSAGRPEAIYVIERLIDLAADAHGFDPVELRRRNLIPPAAMPYTNGVGITYDNGAYEAGMDRALELADWRGFASRRAESRRRGMMRGIGLANYIEGAGGAPRERAAVTIAPEGRVELVLGTMNSGQGHETSFAQLLTEWLGVPFDSVDFVAHDTDRVTAGGGSHSGRSMRIASLAIGEASDEIIAKGRAIAAHVLEAGAADIEFARGSFTIKGTDRSIGIFEVARAAATRKDLPTALRGTLGGIGDHTVSVGAFPSGTHICEVEIDPETGAVRILRWIGVDDVGRAVNPLILHGQTHGAAAQGIGQALLEICHYDRATAQLLSASFMDYAVPRADDLPSFECELMEVPATSHRYGIRPGGEGGTTPALGAVVNAIVDALAELGVRHVEMPATPERVWRAIREAPARAPQNDAPPRPTARGAG